MTAIYALAKGAVQVVLLAFLFLFVTADAPRAAPLGRSEQDANATAPKAATAGAYYIEFRVAQIGTYGHSYVAYGRLNAQGQPAEHRYADLHPIGNYALMALGHLVPVPATTKWDPDVEKLPVSSSWRHRLTAAEYSKLLAAVQRSRANANPTWNAVTNNCNHYVADLAKAIGLRTPSDFQVSYTFIPALRDLNDSAKKKRTSAL
jgi:hypothetical protein